jgi:hypothetical protein
MILRVTAVPCDQFFLDPLGLPVFTDVRPPHREAGRVDFRLGGVLSRWLREGLIDPASPTPVLFSPGSGGTFPVLLVAGAGAFGQLSAPAVERLLAGMTETFLQAKVPLFALAVRDFKRANTPARDSAETILRGLAHGVSLAGAPVEAVVRLHWDEDEADALLHELKRVRHHHPATKEWTVEREPMDSEWMGIDSDK